MIQTDTPILLICIDASGSDWGSTKENSVAPYRLEILNLVVGRLRYAQNFIRTLG